MDNTLRLRMFAGPNGSGKSTLIRELSEIIDFGIYLNADELEKELKNKGYLNFEDFALKITEKDWRQYLTYPLTMAVKVPVETISRIKIDSNYCVIPIERVDSYLAALLTEFLRFMLFQKKKSFSFETVMSHKSKVEFLKNLRESGFRTYLYYIATESFEINIARINTRIQKGGHPVSQIKIKDRYYKSLDLLYSAIKETNRAYIFDNSGTEIKYIAEITEGTQIEMKNKSTPQWFNDVVLSKSV